MRRDNGVKSDLAHGNHVEGWDEDLSVADFSECLPHPAHLTRPTLPHPYEISTLSPLENERTVSTVEA